MCGNPLLIADVLQIYDNLHDTDDSFVGYNGLVTVGSCLCVDGFLLCVVALMICPVQDASFLAAMWFSSRHHHSTVLKTLSQ